MTCRRTFLFELAAAGATLAVGPGVGCAKKRSAHSKSSRSRVVLVLSSTVVSPTHKVDSKQLKAMLSLGLSKLTGDNNPQAALRHWMRPVDTVGLKVNCLAGHQMSTHLALVEELVGLMAQAEISRKNTIVFDRSDQDLHRAGFPVRTSGSDYLCLGNNRVGYESDVRVMPSGASRFSRIATEKASVLVNLPILKDHGIAGLSSALKNNFGLVHNPNKFHLNGCDPHVAEVNAVPVIKEKQRLVICDALRVQVEGGPAYHPAHAATFGGLLFATDPVALDCIAWELLEKLRKKHKLPTLKADHREPKYIATAVKKGLGIFDRNKIDLITVKVKG